MAEDLDALFELFEDEDQAEEPQLPAAVASMPLLEPADAPAGPVCLQQDAADDVDLLLSLADEIVTVPEQAAADTAILNSRANKDDTISPLARSGRSQLTPAACSPSNGTDVGPSQPSSRGLSTSSTTVHMSQAKAFKALNGPSTKRSSLIIVSSSGQPQETRDANGRSSSSTAAKAAKKHSSADCQHFVEKLTGLKIKNPKVSGIVMRERYKQFTYVPISKARDHVAAAGCHWVVIGVLLSKVISSTSQGAPYSRWKVSDLAGSDTWISLFGDAHKDNYAEAEGSIMAFYNPRFASKGPATSSSSSSSGLAVSQPQQVELLASSLGWGVCKGRTKTGARCTNAVDTTVSWYCQYHALQQAKTLRKPPPAAAAAAARGGNRRGINGVSGGVRNGLGLSGSAAGGGGGGAEAAPVIAAASNGKVFDAKSNSWSTTATVPTVVAAAQQHGSSSGGSGARKPGAAGSGGSSSHGSGIGGMHKGVPSPASGAAAAAAAMEACQQQSQGYVQQQRQHQQQQADLRERLRLEMQQKQQQKQNQAPASSSSVSALRRPAAAAAARVDGSRATSAAGFSLSCLLASVASDGQQQQQQQCIGTDSNMEGELVVQSNSKSQPAAVSTIQEPDGLRAAAAQAGGPVGPIGRLPGPSSSTITCSKTSAAAAAHKRMRADLGLGSTLGGSSSSSSVRASSSNSGSRHPHVSRIGTICAKPAAGAAAAGGSNSGFKAAFGRVLQRVDINKPDAKLLNAAADQKHAAMMGKLLDQYEQKDQLAQQLEGITKLQVTAFECRTCKVLTEKRRATCSGHDIVAVRVMKRWWTCDACGWKIHTLRELMPTKRCPKCRDPGVMFSAASAYNAPKPQLTSAGAINNKVASRDAMLPRGIEHAFCLQNSL